MFRKMAFVSMLAFIAGIATGEVYAQQKGTDIAGIEEVVVTASKRTEDMQKLSSDIAVIDGSALSRLNVSRASDLNALVPGVNIGFSLGQMAADIRGIGSSPIDHYVDPSVATNFGNVTVIEPGAALGLLYDLERVEIVKGPQGTLYGRNATGGLINLVPARPGFVFGASAELQYGNYDDKRLKANINVPVSEKFAMRLSYQGVDRDGYMRDGTDDEKSQAARVQGLWLPNDKLSVLMLVSYFHEGGKGLGNTIGPYLNSNPRTGLSSPESSAVLTSLGLEALPNVTKLRYDNWIASATFDWKISDSLGLTVIPAYIHSKQYSLADGGGGLGVNTHSGTQKSIEARLASPAGSKLEWVSGLYAAWVSAPETTELRSFPFGLFQTPVNKDDSEAAFGDFKYRLTNQLRLIGGLRYSRETKKRQESNTVFGFTSSVSNKVVFNDVSYRAGVEYDVAPKSMLFATVSTGYKSGGFTSDIVDNTYQAEKVKQYEVGSKNRFFDNHLQANFSLFYIDDRNRQESFIGALSSGAPGLITKNAGRATMHGADIDIVAMITPLDTISLQGEYLHSVYDSFKFSTLVFAGPPLNACISTPQAGFGRYTVDCQGFQVVRAPTWTGTAGITHRQPLDSGASLSFSAQARYSSSFWNSNEFLPEARQKAYTVGDTSLAYTSASGRYSLTAFVLNMGNTLAFPISELHAATPFTPGLPPVLLESPIPPRTYGLRYGVSF